MEDLVIGIFGYGCMVEALTPFESYSRHANNVYWKGGVSAFFMDQNFDEA